MSTRELIRAAIDNVPEEKLAELYRLVRNFELDPAPTGPGILAKLRTVSIDGPPDFAENFDAYVSGEKRVDDDVS